MKKSEIPNDTKKTTKTQAVTLSERMSEEIHSAGHLMVTLAEFGVDSLCKSCRKLNDYAVDNDDNNLNASN